MKFSHLATLLAFTCLCSCATQRSAIHPDLRTTGQNRDTVITDINYRYEGQWPEGKGTLQSFRHGLVFGTFKEGKPIGTCLNYGANHRIYWGPYVDEKKTGYACVSKNKGAILVRGEFVDGRQHGIDTVYREDGTVIIGRYNKNKFVGSIAEYNYRIPKEIRKAIPKFPKVKLTKEQEIFLKEYNAWYREQSRKRMARHRASDDVKPSFNDKGPNGFAEWVNTRLVYPAQAKKEGIEGMTVLQFTINIDGKLTNPTVLKSSGNILLDEEALRVVKESPDWIPGTQDGKAKSITLTFPVIFKLGKKTKSGI